MPHLRLDGCDLYYEVVGSGPALVFAHGLAGNHMSWWQQVPHFRDRYRCVTFAHRGFFPSTEGPGGPGARAFAGDVAALVEHLGLEDVRLVAQSMGGWTCLDYALSEPGRVRALVMASTTGTASHPRIDRAFAGRRARPESDLFAQGIHPAAGARMASEQPELHHLYQEIAELSGESVDHDGVRAQLMAMRTVTPERLSSLNMPVLCISGEEDIVIPTEAVEAFAALLPDARFEQVPQAGHSVYFERAETFNRLVDEFLAGV